MGIKDDYYIRPIEYQSAMYYFREYHYLHRAVPSSFHYAIYEIDNGRLGDIKGVVAYGTPCASSLRQGVCGYDERLNVIELMRLWTTDDSPRNMESFLIGNTIPKVDKEIIVSYADPSVGHVGYVYQATNWIYTGVSNKTDEWILDGESKHSHTITDRFSLEEINQLQEEGRLKMEKSEMGKHRYIYFNCNKRRKRELKRKLKYPIKDYPKED